jgi:hypothetical protein
MKRLSGLWTFVNAFMNESVKLSNTPACCSDAELPLCGLVFMVAFQSEDSRKMMRRALRRRTGWSVRRERKRCRLLARRSVKSGPNRSPRTYSILCLSGSGGTAQAGYSRKRVL